MPKWSGKWIGSRTYAATDGSTRWIIHKTVAGVAYNVTLDVRSEAEAQAELAAFRLNPAAYRTASQERQDEAQQAQEDAAQAVFLDEDRARRFLLHLKASGRSDEYLKSTRSYLAAWATALVGKDLRAVTRPALKKILATWDTGKKWRIIVFKSFTSFLQDSGELDPMVNPGRVLKVPLPAGTTNSRAPASSTSRSSTRPSARRRSATCCASRPRPEYTAPRWNGSRAVTARPR